MRILGYKDFDVAFFFQGIGNVTGFIGGETIDMSDTNQLFSNVYQDVALNYWRPDRPMPNIRDWQSVVVKTIKHPQPTIRWTKVLCV